MAEEIANSKTDKYKPSGLKNRDKEDQTKKQAEPQWPVDWHTGDEVSKEEKKNRSRKKIFKESTVKKFPQIWWNTSNYRANRSRKQNQSKSLKIFKLKERERGGNFKREGAIKEEEEEMIHYTQTNKSGDGWLLIRNNEDQKTMWQNF